MFCQNCGKKVEDGSVFCQYCGAKQATPTDANKTVNSAQTASQPVSSPVVNTVPNSATVVRPSNPITLDYVLGFINNIISAILLWCAKVFSKKHKVYYDNLETSKSKVPQAYILTPSNKLDFSNIEKKYTESPFTKLGGGFAVFVYGGMILSGVLLIYAFVKTIFKVITLTNACLIFFKSNSSGVIFAFCFGFFDIIFYILFMFFVVCFMYRFCYKLKNGDIDSIHFFFKSTLWCVILYAIYFTQDLLYNMVFSFYNFGVTASSSLGSLQNSLSNSSSLFDLGTSAVNSVGNTISSGLGALGSIFSFLGGIPTFMHTLVIVMLFCVLLCFYLCKSIRVRTYMGTDAYLRVSQFTRNVLAAVPDGGDESMNTEVCSTDGRKIRTVATSNITKLNSKINQFGNTQGQTAQTANTAQPSAKVAEPKATKTSVPATESNAFCGKCGSKIIPGNGFCTKCGAKVE